MVALKDGMAPMPSFSARYTGCIGLQLIQHGADSAFPARVLERVADGAGGRGPGDKQLFATRHLGGLICMGRACRAVIIRAREGAGLLHHFYGFHLSAVFSALPFLQGMKQAAQPCQATVTVTA